MQIRPNFIDGVWNASAEFSTNTNPSDVTDVIGRFSRVTAADTHRAIEAAKRALGPWSSTPPFQRAAALQNIACTMRARSNELAELLAREEGKTMREALGEVSRSAQTFEYFAFALQLETGQTFASSRPGVSIHTQRRAVGVVAVITPWNFPLAVPSWKIAPALAYGNTVVFKPAEVVNASGFALAEIIAQSGIPAGVFNLVMGSGREVGGIVAGHPDVNAISFTGSTAVGQRLLGETHARSNARVQTELGGKNGIVVLDDADISLAVDCIVDSAFGATGQRCTASSRIIATSGIYQRLTDRLVDRMKQIRVGHALAPDTNMGPVAHEDQLNSDLDYIDVGISEGAELVSGGHLIEQPTDGFYLAPTLFIGGTTAMRLNQEEVFGPVACMIEASDLDDAIEKLNDTDYGLSAGCITQSLEASTHFQNRARAGLISVNASPAISEHHVPFGGISASGHGPREQGASAIEFFTEQTTHFVFTH